MERTKEFPETMYDELCKTLTDFENATKDNTSEDWSWQNGYWSDVFYNLCVKLQNSVLQ